MRDTDWAERAACLNRDPDELFVRGAAQSRAKLICAPCPVRRECLAEALDNRISIAIRGGMTERGTAFPAAPPPRCHLLAPSARPGPCPRPGTRRGRREPRAEKALAEIITDVPATGGR